jgi:hypothetical protein
MSKLTEKGLDSTKREDWAFFLKGCIYKCDPFVISAKFCGATWNGRVASPLIG